MAYGTPLSRTRCSCSRCLSSVPKGLSRTMGMSTTVLSAAFFAGAQAVRVTAAEDSSAREVPWSRSSSCSRMRSTVALGLPTRSSPFSKSTGDGRFSSNDTHHTAADAPSTAARTSALLLRSATCSSNLGSASASPSASVALARSRTTARTAAMSASSSSRATTSRPTRPLAPNTVTTCPPAPARTTTEPEARALRLGATPRRAGSRSSGAAAVRRASLWRACTAARADGRGRRLARGGEAAAAAERRTAHIRDVGDTIAGSWALRGSG
mmetsp:Transcript_41568/g.105314  ORF Transcript_41568/g.105314 Transcript_41568/m.105314 type:complete len:269 (-) Transcript_41568:66-872(-)